MEMGFFSIRFFKSSRPRAFVLAAVMVTFSILTSCSPPQPAKVWTKQAGSPADDFAYSTAIGKDGGVYVAGSTAGGIDGLRNMGYRDYVLIKYDASGNKLWSEQAGSQWWEEAYSVASDKDANAYVAGYTFGGLDGMGNGLYDAFLAKYSPEGKRLWIRQLGTADSDYAYSITSDKDGNAYVAGYTYAGLERATNAGGADFFIAKYDANGNKLWVKQMGTASDDIAYSVSVDKDGNAYVTGCTGAGFDGNINLGNRDVFLVKFDTNGNKLWSRQEGTPLWDEAWAVTTDKDGNAYIAGYTGAGMDGNKSHGAFDAFVIKYGTNGNKLWSRQIGTSENDYARAVAVDAEGNAYIAGYTEGGAAGMPGSGASDVFTAGVDSNGKRLGLYQTGTASGDYAFGIAVDDSRNIYMAGETAAGLAETEASAGQGGYDIFLLKLNVPPKQGFSLSRCLDIAKDTLKKIGIGK